ncbi:hypothetical protein [Streptomyces sp. TRM64462]|uniref:hypothetical protein n=1 Tax=Streptomyces sp. TRM64462 TaxID=2741726 RepID=UPI00158608D2|nr:hypothetical protein [Streptomyces sp. TRM64462]
MSVPLWILLVVIPEAVLTCVLLRWLPVRSERWIPALPLPVIAVVALALRFVAHVPWPAAFAACAGFLWGVVLALVPFRGWVSSWTMPVRGDARLRWREVALATVGAVTPVSTKGTSAALEKAFTVRQVVRARGPFPLPLGVALLVVPVACALGAVWAAGALGWT